MNKPALNTFGPEKINYISNAWDSLFLELKSYLDKMLERKNQFEIIKKDKTIIEWMHISIKNYEDIIYASLMENISIDFSKDFNNDKDKIWAISNVFVQKWTCLNWLKEKIGQLQSAKNDFKANAIGTLALLEHTINNTQMILVSMVENHKLNASDISENEYHYKQLEVSCNSLIKSYYIISDAHNALSSISLNTLANIIIIKLFKEKVFSTDGFILFCKSEEVRLLLQDIFWKIKENIFEEHKLPLIQIENQKTEINTDLDNLEISTNIVIGKILKNNYIKLVFQQIDYLREILSKFEVWLFEQKVMLKKINKEIEQINFSGNLLNIFGDIHKVIKNYEWNIRTLSGKYTQIKNFKNIKNTLENLKTLYFKLKVELISKIKNEYQDVKKTDSLIKPEVSVRDVVRKVNPARMGLFKMFYYVLLIFFDKKVFDEQMITEALKKYDKIPSVEEQSNKRTIRDSIEELLYENREDFFHKENVDILEQSAILYMKRVKEYIWGFPLDSEHSEIKNIDDLLENIKKSVEINKSK